MGKKKFIVYRLRKYLRRLYKGYPSHFFYGYEKVDGVEEGIKNLLEDGIIKNNEFQKGYKQSKSPVYGSIMLIPIMKREYRLTAEGLKLVESWNIERLTDLIIVLSILTFLVGLIQIFFKLPIIDIICLFG